MKYVILLSCCLILAGCYQTSTDLASNKAPSPADPKGRISVGNGGGKIPWDANSAWVLGTDPLEVCILYSHSFPISFEESITAITAGRDKWLAYMAPRFSMEDESTIPNLNFTINRECTGNEFLVFNLGEEDGEVISDKVQFSHHKDGFAIRTNYDPQARKGSGYIYIDPSALSATPLPARYNAFQSIVTHELGHVIGCEDVAHTVMDPGIGDLIENYSGYVNWKNALLTQIDGSSRELSICEKCPIEFLSEESLNSATLSALLGKTVPEATVRLHFQSKNGLFKKSELVVLEGDNELGRCQVEGTIGLASHVIGPSIFKRAWEEGEYRRVEESFPLGRNYSASIINPKGERFGLTIHRNIADKFGRPIAFSFLIDLGEKVLPLIQNPLAVGEFFGQRGLQIE